MESPEARAQLVEWVRAHAGETVRWGQPHEEVVDSEGRQVFTSWVDVYVPEVLEDCPMGWVWTVEDPEEPGEVAWYTAPAPCDTVVLEVWDDRVETHGEGEGRWYSPGVVHREVRRVTDPLTKEQEEALADALTPDRTLVERDGWSEDAVNAALTRWCEAEAGAALGFEYEPGQALSGHARAAAEAVLAGGETYLVGVGADGTEIHASEGAFDQLAQLDPEDLEALMELMGRVAHAEGRDGQ